MIGRTNAGGGMKEIKVVTGKTTVKSNGGTLVTVDFKPLIAVAYTPSYRVVNGSGDTYTMDTDGLRVIYRSNTSDGMATFHMGTYGNYVTCGYNASYGAVTVGFDDGDSSQNCDVHYIVLGVA